MNEPRDRETTETVVGVKTWEPVPKPTVKGACKTCHSSLAWGVRPVGTIVSPRGIEHVGCEDGDTLCGRDATGDAWWWPL